jgi:serine/threonine protein kinase
LLFLVIFKAITSFIPFADLVVVVVQFSGGGQIFKGTYNGTPIAAKQVYAALPDAQEDFDREVAVLAKLSHPCIVSLFGVSRNPHGDLFMVLEVKKKDVVEWWWWWWWRRWEGAFRIKSFILTL